MSIKNLAKKLIFREKYDSASYVKFLKNAGVTIGKGTWFVSPRHSYVDLTRPFLIEIGENVTLTHDIIILTHGFEWSVMNCKYGDIMGSAGKVTIGNNVFIGVRTTILKGVHIGNNVVIGAGSIVSHDIPDNCVAVGSPAKVICDLDTFYEKRKAAQLAEAKEVATAYYQKYQKKPPKELFHEFFWLFEERTEDGFTNACFEKKMHTNKNYEMAVARYQSTKRLYSSYDAFLKDCFLQ